MSVLMIRKNPRRIAEFQNLIHDAVYSAPANWSAASQVAAAATADATAAQRPTFQAASATGMT